ncbi:putative diacyglycerol O-acyltransferase MT1809 [Clytia hemisphaerica]|uniref:Diacylglycerol O-acyltransferase n=1 Tax=Clytia hemisphaerica TaxID=252671 RepID=A0A7M5V1Z9_9CNID
MSMLYLKYIDSGLPVLIHAILCILAYLVWSVAALLIGPVICLFRTFKFFETSLIKYKRFGTIFSTYDVPFLHETENNRNYIVGLIRVQGEPNITELRKWVLYRLFESKSELDETYKRLSQRIRRRYLSYVWEDEDCFNIKQHMKMFKGATPRTEAEEQKIFENLATEDISRNISPWLFKIIPTANKKSYLIFVKFHHTIGDGFAMVGLLSRLVDKRPEFLNFSKSTRKTNFMANPIKRAITGIITGPLAMLVLVFSFRIKNPFRAKTPPVKKIVSWTPPISLDLVRRIKTKTESTVNDVMMSCLAGAIRRYLSEVRQKKPQDFPIAMTFNARSSSAKLADTIPLGNKSGGLFLSLPVSVENPIERLDITRARLNKLKTLSHPHLFSFLYFSVIGGLPELIGRISTYSINRHASMIVSNVPGPTEPIFILGSPIESIVFTPPLHGDVGMAASVFSYNKKIRVTLMSDKTIVRDLPRLTNFFTQEVQRLEEIILLND